MSSNIVYCVIFLTNNSILNGFSRIFQNYRLQFTSKDEYFVQYSTIIERKRNLQLLTNNYLCILKLFNQKIKKKAN